MSADRQGWFTGLRASLRTAFVERPRAPDSEQIAEIAAAIDRMGERATRLAELRPAESVEEAIEMIVGGGQ